MPSWVRKRWKNLPPGLRGVRIRNLSDLRKGVFGWGSDIGGLWHLQAIMDINWNTGMMDVLCFYTYNGKGLQFHPGGRHLHISIWDLDMIGQWHPTRPGYSRYSPIRVSGPKNGDQPFWRQFAQGKDIVLRMIPDQPVPIWNMTHLVGEISPASFNLLSGIPPILRSLNIPCDYDRAVKAGRADEVVEALRQSDAKRRLADLSPQENESFTFGFETRLRNQPDPIAKQWEKPLFPKDWWDDLLLLLQMLDAVYPPYYRKCLESYFGDMTLVAAMCRGVLAARSKYARVHRRINTENASQLRAFAERIEALTHLNHSAYIRAKVERDVENDIVGLWSKEQAPSTNARHSQVPTESVRPTPANNDSNQNPVASTIPTKNQSGITGPTQAMG